MPGTGRRRLTVDPWIGAVGLLVLLAGCRESGLRSCTDLLAAKRYTAAVERCEQVYAAKADPRAGAAAVRAHYNLGHRDQVVAGVKRLAGTEAATGLHSLAAWVYEQRGETGLAEKEYRRDLSLHRAAGDHVRAAQTLYRLFYLCWQASRYREAFDFAIQTMAEAEEGEDRKSRQFAAQALHTVLYAVGDLEGARRALEMEHGLADSEDRAEQARFLANRGGLLLDGSRFALARRDLERALETAAGEGDRLFFRSVHLNLVQLHLDLGDLDRAEDHLRQAWRYAEPEGPVATSLLYYQAHVDLARGRAATAARSLVKALNEKPVPDWTWDLEYQLGRSKEAGGDVRQAEEAFERSAATVEEMRRSLVFDDLKSWLLDRKRQPFEALFLLQARAGRAQGALQTAERMQARTFLDAFLNAASAPRSAGSQPWSVERTASRLTALESLLPAMSESPVASLRPLERVLERFGDRHALVYVEAGDQIWLIVVAGHRISLRRLAVSAVEAEQLAERFLARPDEAAIADRLGEVLLPSGSLPASGKTIYVAADGALGNLPFAAVRRDGRFVVEDHAVVLAPSLNALVALEGQIRDGSGSAILLADPRGDLPAAASEAEQLAGLLRGGRVRISGQASFAELKRASRARLLHLATHTGLGTRGPWLRLADRDVTAAEIVTGRIGPRLVVLASCASAVRPGRQMWGSLSAAFLAAGSQSVLASLWSVEDERARDLVLRFYAAGGVADPAGALARAQRVAIGQRLSPKDWAPFVLQGSAGPSNASQGDQHVVAMALDGDALRSRLRQRLPGEGR
jgi:tetratricopeptide (TPR) repeat protein